MAIAAWVGVQRQPQRRRRAVFVQSGRFLMSVGLGTKVSGSVLLLAIAAAVGIAAPRTEEAATPSPNAPVAGAPAGGDSKQVVNKPVITEKMLAEAGKAAPRLFKRKLAARGIKVPVGGGDA